MRLWVAGQCDAARALAADARTAAADAARGRPASAEGRAVAGALVPAGVVEDAVGPAPLARAVESGLLVHTPDGTPVFRHGAARRIVLEELPAAVHADVRRRLLDAAHAHGLTVVPDDVLTAG